MVRTEIDRWIDTTSPVCIHFVQRMHKEEDITLRKPCQHNTVNSCYKYLNYFRTALLRGNSTCEISGMKMTVFWGVAPCSLVEVHRRFRGACCLHHEGDRNTAQQPRGQPSSNTVRVQVIVIVWLVWGKYNLRQS
jgi:hypothetical protein